jgi:hypothetical protein
MQLNDKIRTPRFHTVRINAIMTADDARELGYMEPTHYDDGEYIILGRHIETNRMVFAAVIKG